MQKLAKNLTPGDKISTGTIVYVGRPGAYCGSKNQVRIDIRYNNMSEGCVTRYWNANTKLTLI